jgi:hypothetical protein
MSLFVAIQVSIDIAYHISADEGWGVPSLEAEQLTLDRWPTKPDERKRH